MLHEIVFWILISMLVLCGMAIGWLIARSNHMPQEQMDYWNSQSAGKQLKTMIRWMKWDVKVFLSRLKW